MVRRAHRILGPVGADRMAALGIFAKVEGLAEFGVPRRHWDVEFTGAQFATVTVTLGSACKVPLGNADEQKPAKEGCASSEAAE